MKTAGSLSHQSIVNGFASLKLELASTLEKLEEKLTNEFRHFEDLQQAVAIEKENKDQVMNSIKTE